jgi:hypothetical protein
MGTDDISFGSVGIPRSAAGVGVDVDRRLTAHRRAFIHSW